MQLVFKQRFFSWFDSYDIYDGEGRTVYTVEGRLAWGHRLEIYGPAGDHLGTVKEELLTLLPRVRPLCRRGVFGLYSKGIYPVSPPLYPGLQRLAGRGRLPAREYRVTDGAGRTVMQASKQLFRWTDTYVLEVARAQDALLV